MGSWGSLVCRAYPDTGTRTSEDVFYVLAIRGPTHGEGMPGIKPGSGGSPDPQSSPLPLHRRFDGLLWCTTIQWFEYTAEQILKTLIVKTWPDVSCFDELVFIWVIQALQNVYDDLVQVPCYAPLHYLSKCKKVLLYIFILSCLFLSKLIRIIIWSFFCHFHSIKISRKQQESAFLECNSFLATGVWVTSLIE